jgi:hypothetical protein
MTGINDSVETYEPKINMGYENSIPKVDTSFDDITDENGNINIIINSDVIGQTLAKRIYTSWASGLRELYNNEARACRMSKKLGGNPSIVITINPSDSSRELTIQGVDSLGITKAMFAKVLRVIGTSGNNDSNEIGQFGMGFISYALLTDAVLLETWSRENEEHYSMLCDSGLKFKPIPLEKSNDISTMSDYGTKLTMTCNEDVNFSEAVHNIKELARFSDIPTKIILLDDIFGSNSYYSRSNGGDESYDKGIIECESYDNGMDYIKADERGHHLNNSNREDSEKVLFYKELTIDNEDYRFDGIMVVRKSSYGTINIMSNTTLSPMLLAGTSIDSTIRIKGFLSAIINIKNERKYPPVASRDSLESKAVIDIEEMLEEDIKESMSEYDIESIEEYNNSLHKCLLARNVMWELSDYLSAETNNISSTLNTKYGTPDKTTSTLSDMLSGGEKLICLKSLRMDLMKALDESFDEKVQFFRIPKKLDDSERGHRISLFKQLGIIMGEEYKKKNKIKEKRSTVTRVVDGVSKKISFSGDRSIILYNSKRGYNKSELFGNRSGWRSGSEKYSTTIQDVNDNIHDKMIAIPTMLFEECNSIMNQQTCDWKIMHDMKGLDDKIETYNKLMVKIANIMFQTNNGLVKGSSLDGNYNLIIAKEELLDNVKIKEGKTYISVKSTDDIISLLWYTKDRSVELEIDQNGYHLADNILVDCNSEFHKENYDDKQSTRILRLYWIQQLLPSKYSNVFMRAIKYDTIDIDKVEEIAKELSEMLEK